MKNKILVLCLMLIVALTASSLILVACDTQDGFTVSFMDGDTLLSSSLVSKDNPVVSKPADPIKKGYTFVGWYTDKELSIGYNFDNTFDTDIILYAKFAKANLYIAINPNGGEELDLIAVNVGEEYSVPTPVREGYTFVNYTVDGEEFAQSGTYSRENAIRITANWTINNYTVSFKTPDDKEYSGDQQVEYKKKATLPAITQGYTLQGVYSDKELTTSVDVATTEIKANTVFYINLTANTYTITIDNKGGEGDTTKTVAFNSDYTLTAPTKAGYTFGGFSTISSTFPLTGKYTLLSDINLTADWTINSYSVTFKKADGTVIGTPTTIEFGKKATLPAIENGYSLEGIYSDESLENKIDFANATVSAETVYYLNITANTYTITIDNNGGEGETTKTVAYNSEYTLTAPTKTGYTFGGYSTISSSFPISGKYTLLSDIKLTASWTINSYTVTFKKADGTVIGNPSTIEFGKKATLPAIENGYTLEGIYSDENLENKIDFATATIGSETVYFLNITANTYTITIDNNGGEGETTKTVAFNSEYTITAPTKTGYTFGGFSTFSSTFPLTGKYTLLSDINLTASWTINSYSVTFKKADSTVIGTPSTVEYGKKATAPTAEDGYVIEGFYTAENMLVAVDVNAAIVADTVIFVNIIPATFQITVNEYGKTDVSTTATYLSAYSIATPQRDGYTFIGFRYNGVDFAATGTFSYTQNINVTAIWEKIEGYGKSTVSFYDGLREIAEYRLTVDDGSVLTSEQVKTPAKDGSNFLYWCTDKELNNSFDLTTAISVDTILYAKFEAIEYTITIDENGGNAVNDYTATYNNAYQLPTPQRTGYTFTGYTYDEDDFPAKGTYLYLKNISVKANWSVNTYSVTYKRANGNQYGPTQTIEYNSFASAPAAETGFELVGIYSDSQLSISVDVTTLKITQNTVLYVSFAARTFTISIDENGGEAVNDYTATYGNAYQLPSLTRTGYTFTGYSSNNDSFPTGGTFMYLNDISVKANWSINSYSVTFKLANGNQYGISQTIQYNGFATAPVAETGFDLVGIYSDSQLSISVDIASLNITDNTVLYVAFAAKTFTVSIDENGGETVNDYTATYGNAYQLPTPQRTGYTFTGYTLDEDDFLAKGTYMYLKNISVKANWSINNYSVTFKHANGNQYGPTQTIEYNSFASAPVAETGFELGGIYSDSALSILVDISALKITQNTVLFVSFTAKTYTIIIDENEGNIINDLPVTYNEAYTLPTPTRNGYKFVGYTYNGSAFSLTGVYRFTDSITVIANWEKILVDAEEGGQALFIEKSNYFKERISADDNFEYVFLSGVTYNFDNQTIQIKNNNSNATKNGSSLFAGNTTGSFVLSITKNIEGTPVTYERNCRVVSYIYSFTKGASTNAVNATGYDQNFHNGLVSSLKAGINNYKPDVIVSDNTGAAINLKQAEMLVTVKSTDGTVLTYNNVSPATVDQNGVISFSAAWLESLSSKNVVITLSPKYALSANNIDDISINLTLNTGVNVYTNDELSSAFADTAIGEINILRNITVALKESNLSGGTPINGYNGAPYLRTVYSTDTSMSKTLTLNGNSFKLDGSNLPLVSPTDFTGGSGSSVAIIGVSVFRFRSLYSPQSPENVQDATFNVSNLYLVANYDVNRIAEYSNGNSGYILMSASYNGIYSEGGKFNVENTTVTNALIGLYANGGIDTRQAPNGNTYLQYAAAVGSSASVDNYIAYCNQYYRYATAITFNNVIAKNCWANDVYLWNASSTLITNSYFGASGGAAVHVDDCANGRETIDTVSYAIYDLANFVSFGENVVLDNWLIGEEPYLVGYGLSAMVPTLKSQVNAGLSAYGMTMTKQVTVYPNGQLTPVEVSMFNFGFMAKTSSDSNTYVTQDYDKELSVKTDLPMLGMSPTGNYYCVNQSFEGIGSVKIYVYTMPIS